MFIGSSFTLWHICHLCSKQQGRIKIIVESRVAAVSWILTQTLSPVSAYSSCFWSCFQRAATLLPKSHVFLLPAKSWRLLLHLLKASGDQIPRNPAFILSWQLGLDSSCDLVEELGVKSERLRNKGITQRRDTSHQRKGTPPEYGLVSLAWNRVTTLSVSDLATDLWFQDKYRSAQRLGKEFTNRQARSPPGRVADEAQFSSWPAATYLLLFCPCLKCTDLSLGVWF